MECNLRPFTLKKETPLRIYVSNIPFTATDVQFDELFAPYGPVKSAKLITDRETGRPRGFGFVEMEDDGDAERAIKELNGLEWGGRKIVVQQAQERAPQSGGRQGGGYGGGGGYRGNAGPSRNRGQY